jgi:hypothetical protein
MMEILLRISAVALAGAAVYFYWAGEPDWLFASLVLAACSFFLSIRFKLKKRINEANAGGDGQPEE